MSNELQKYTAARIAKIENVGEVARVKGIADAAQLFYDAQGDYLTAQEAKEISMRSVHRAGQILGDAEKGKGGGDSTCQAALRVKSQYADMLEEAGITRQTGADWQRIGMIPVDKIEEFFAINPYEGNEYSLGWLKRYASGWIPDSTGDEWYTPARYIESARKVMGEIDLDPASSKQANQIVKAKQYLTKEDDGLSRPWWGRMFMNPPYSMNKPFAEKMLDEYGMGNVDQAVVLVGAHAIETQWFKDYWDYVLCFTGHRIRFITPEGEQVAGNIAGSVFIYLGDKQKGFAEEFAQHGYVVKRWP